MKIVRGSTSLIKFVQQRIHIKSVERAVYRRSSLRGDRVTRTEHKGDKTTAYNTRDTKL